MSRSNSVVFGVTYTGFGITTLTQSTVFLVIFLLPRSHGYSSFSPTPPYTIGYTHFSVCWRDIHHESISSLYETGDWWHCYSYQTNQGRETRRRLDLLWVSDCWREDVIVREKPGYCITSSISLHSYSPSSNGIRFLSFPSLGTNCSPSYIAYEESVFQSLSSKLPLSEDQTIELPFLLHITETL